MTLDIKMPAHNGRFGASGAVSRPTLCVEQTLPLSSKPQWDPPPAAKPLGRWAQWTTQYHRENFCRLLVTTK